MSDPSNVTLTVGVPRETAGDERRVALVPAGVAQLGKAGLKVLVERGAGHAAGFPDDQYTAKGAEVVERGDLFERAEVIVQVRAAGACPGFDGEPFRSGRTLIAACEPLSEPEPLRQLAERGVTTFALELVPRITRAQSMDILSSMATIAGYKAVLLAADALPRMFPMMMTAAGTLTPAKVFIVGAGVAGLQAIATAKRLGAVVSAYDVRPAVREQVESLGGKFVEMELETAEGTGGYAKEMDEEFYRRQRELMTRVVAEQDVVITTAAIPGRTAPVLVTDEMVRGMRPGSVIVDIAVERGGNVEPSVAGETIVAHDVTILGPVNLPGSIPYHASEMYSKNVVTFLLNMIATGEAGGETSPSLDVNLDDAIVRDTLVTRDGEVTNPRIREALGLTTNVE